MGGVCLLFGEGCERLDMLITADDGILIWTRVTGLSDMIDTTR